MRAAFRFRHDFIDHAQLNQIIRGQLQRFRRFRRMFAIFPQNRGAGFRADDGIIGVLQNQDAVRHANAERAAGTAFANDGGDNRHPQRHHFAQIDGDRFRNVAFLRADAGIGARRIDQRDDWQTEFLRRAA